MNKNNTVFSILIVIIIIVIIIFMMLFLSKFSYNDNDYNEMLSYYVQTPIKDDGENMNYCLEGCIRGTCKKSNSNNSCKNDFQCQYCQDKKTNMFYVNFDNEREIVPLYEEEDKLGDEEKLLLNESIKKNNIYIDQLNHRIEILNS
jgi:hypothetical protein